MEQQRVIVKKLRKLSGLTIAQAACKINKSAGWLSEIENNKGRSVLRPKDYETIYNLLDGEKYKHQFGAWVKYANQKNKKHFTQDFDGAIYKFLRKQKAKLSIREVVKKNNISPAYLSLIENGLKRPSLELKNKILQSYGYKPSSWKNFSTKDDRSKAIPILDKISIVLKKMNKTQLEQVYEFIINKNS